MKKICSLLLALILLAAALPLGAWAAEDGTDEDIPVYEATEIRLVPDRLSLTVGEAQSLDVEALPVGAHYPILTWSSEDESVAAVDETGLVTAVSPGQTTVHAQAETTDGLISASCAVTVKKAPVAIPFTDVAGDDWFRDAVGYVYENKLFNGSGNKKFSPNQGMNRAMFVTVLGRKSGVVEDDYLRYRFRDTKLDEYFAPYVEWAAQYGIVKGMDKTRFNPGGLISREQMAAILYRYAQKTGNDTSYSDELYNKFPDKGKVSPYAVTAMKWATTHRVLKGQSGLLNPQGTATRAQVAQVFYNSRELLENAQVSGQPVLAPEPKFNPVPMNRLANYASLSQGLTQAELTQAYNAAVKLCAYMDAYTPKTQMRLIAYELRKMFDSGMDYSTDAPHYADVYGYFITKKASCAGCARATGLCLNILGLSYEHVNENQWSHQWCRVKLGGEYWISDAFGLYAGPEPAPYKHPYL